MQRKRKKKPQPPRRKRMNRSARLASGRHWLRTRSRKNVVQHYARWFGVDPLCAVKELGLLGVDVGAAEVAAIERAQRDKIRARAQARARREADSRALHLRSEEDVDDDAVSVFAPTYDGLDHEVERVLGPRSLPFHEQHGSAVAEEGTPGW